MKKQNPNYVDEKAEEISRKAEEIESSKAENDLYNRMKLSIKTGDLLVAAEDGVKLIAEYPGSRKADAAASDILAIYLGLAAKSEDKFANLKNEVLAIMRKADAQRQYEWAQTLFARENYLDSLRLIQNSLTEIKSHPSYTKMIMLAALASLQSGNLDFAYDYFSKLVLEHSGTKISIEAMFRMGLIEMRKEKFAEAANHFERFLLLEHNGDFESAAMYWLWRAKQKLAPDKADVYAKNLATKYPINYYGLRAMAELSSGKIEFAKKLPKRPSWTFQFLDSDYQAWMRFLILNKAGWEDEALAELDSLEEPQDAVGKLIFAYIWSQARGYFRSSEILARTFQTDNSLIAIETLKIAYPTEHQNEIKKESLKYKYPSELVAALIKQESSYRQSVVSPAGAVGLMQIMPTTAKEVGKDMRIKLSNVAEDLTQAPLNIKIGTQYLHRRLRAFDGHVPLALAAYNAGIGNVRNWLRARVDLNGVDKNHTSNPMNELWFDELPWVETTGYIKSVLRNYVIYKTLDQGTYQLQSPIWKLVEK